MNRQPILFIIGRQGMETQLSLNLVDHGYETNLGLFHTARRVFFAVVGLFTVVYQHHTVKKIISKT